MEEIVLDFHRLAIRLSISVFQRGVIATLRLSIIRPYLFSSISYLRCLSVNVEQRTCPETIGICSVNTISLSRKAPFISPLALILRTATDAFILNRAAVDGAQCPNRSTMSQESWILGRTIGYVHTSQWPSLRNNHWKRIFAADTDRMRSLTLMVRPGRKSGGEV